MDRWTTQLRKGLAEYAVLLALAHGETYGYALQKSLSETGAFALSESTLYPILNRLRHESAVRTRKVASPSGPPRTYYQLTAAGRRRLAEMSAHWKLFHEALHNLNSHHS